MIQARSAFNYLLLALCLGACATRPTTDVNDFAVRSANNSFESFDRAVDPSALVLALVHDRQTSAALVLALVHDRQTSAASCGAHALASIINYWYKPGAVTGAGLFLASPPADTISGYSLAELLVIARRHHLAANAVTLSQVDLTAELEAGRPVLVPIQAPAIYLESRTLPFENVPVIGAARNFVISRVAQFSETSNRAMASHYLIVAGYDDDTFIVVEPVRGYRTISFERLARYRRRFNDAALVFSTNAPAPRVRAARNQSWITRVPFLKEGDGTWR